MEYPSPSMSIDGDCSVCEDDRTSDTSQITDAEMSSRFVGAELNSALPGGLRQLLSTCHEMLSTSEPFALYMQVVPLAVCAFMPETLSQLPCEIISCERQEHRQFHQRLKQHDEGTYRLFLHIFVHAGELALTSALFCILNLKRV